MKKGIAIFGKGGIIKTIQKEVTRRTITMKTTTTAADLARKSTATKNPHGLAFDILFDEALEALEKEEAEKMK